MVKPTTKWKYTYHDGIKQHQETAENEIIGRAIINKVKLNRWTLEKIEPVKGVRRSTTKKA